MDEYHSIDTIWKRDERGRIQLGEFTCPEFEYLAGNRWVGTEKVDGTNIRVMYNEGRVTLGGKTDNAQIPAHLINRLQEVFTPELLAAVGQEHFCLYGEGYGAKIQKGGGNYNSKGCDFALFDVKIDGWWLRRPDVADIATKLGITIVPIVFTGTLYEACELVKAGQQSTWGNFMAEGLVLLPETPLCKRDGSRLITKIKHRDYA